LHLGDMLGAYVITDVELVAAVGRGIALQAHRPSSIPPVAVGGQTQVDQFGGGDSQGVVAHGI
jgi:hypothetical protein